MKNEFLPYAQASIGTEEIEEVVKTLKSGWLTMGPKTIELEQLLAEYTESRYAVAVNSCTAALHLSLLALKIGPGDEVITSPYTFAATGNMIVQVGATPVFVDIQRDSGNIDPEKINNAISSKTKAIIPVDFAGQPCDYKEIREIADDNGLYLIEDAAHSIGSEYLGDKVGTLADATCFSFYATKNMTTGEGGAITTDDKKLADKLSILRLHGISRDAWKRYSQQGSWYYEIEECGWKYNMTDLQASIGVHQIKKLDTFIAIRREYADLYSNGLKKLRGISVPSELPGRKHAYHLYPILLKEGNRDRFFKEMHEKGIGCSVHFIPLHMHPFYKKNLEIHNNFPNAEWFYEREISLPLYPKMKISDVERVIQYTYETFDTLYDREAC
jgi:UDP-4-amino-4,6-dideoxy-N-acetyl-beta-L-altrosamine transaminase